MSIFLDQESFARFEKNRTSLMPNKCASFVITTGQPWEGGKVGLVQSEIGRGITTNNREEARQDK